MLWNHHKINTWTADNLHSECNPSEVSGAADAAGGSDTDCRRLHPVTIAFCHHVGKIVVVDRHFLSESKKPLMYRWNPI